MSKSDEGAPFEFGPKPMPNSPGMRSWGPSHSRDVEAAYRRGYHQAIAHAAEALIAGEVTAQDLMAWAEPQPLLQDAQGKDYLGPDGPGVTWRKDLPLTEKIDPPPLKQQRRDLG